MSEMPTLNVETVENPPTIDTIPIVDTDIRVDSFKPEEYFLVCHEYGIIQKICRKFFNNDSEFFDYVLRKNIAGEDFIFRILEIEGYGEGVYSIDYISEKYRYAVMNFSPEELNELGITIISFIKSVTDANPKIFKLKFSGAPTSYTKQDVDEGRKLLEVSSNYSKAEIENMEPTFIRDQLYREDIAGTPIQIADNNYGKKRENVFSRALNKLFKKYNLPYTVTKSEYLGDVYIERIG